jgi:hypothetical protein
MTLRTGSLNCCTLAAATVSVLLFVAGCSPESKGLRSGSGSVVTAQAKDRWSELLRTTPYPYTLPLPSPKRSVLDGTYVKFDPKGEPPVHCLRCPDYAPEGGVWKLHLDRGIFRIFHEVTGWQSAGSFVITRDRVTKLEYPERLVLFNDPTCTGVVGCTRGTTETGT